jgi:hypothetical protein
MIDPVSRRYLSEDYAFCRRWQMMGGKIHAHIHTTRDNEKLLPHATLERQILALKIKLKSCSVKQFFPLQNKIKQLEKQLAERKNGEGWDNYLAL